MTKRGPKRKTPLDGDAMATVTARLPAWLILKLDEQARDLARETGVHSINRSDVMRKLLESALQAK